MGILILIIAIAAIVWHRSTRADTINNNFLTCPSISQIHKNPVKGNWIANLTTGSWKSFHMSFGTNLTQFIGAEWSGENVGKVACVYRSEQRFNLNGQSTIEPTLPVVLVFHTLVFAPTNGKWQHAQHGKRNCASYHRTDCPFKPNIAPSAGDIFQQAESLKKAPSGQEQNN